MEAPLEVFSTALLPIGVFTHVAATAAVTTSGGTQVCVYIDGIKKNCAPANFKAQNTGDTIQIGGVLGQTGNPVNYFNGIIDEVELWNDALTEEEIRSIFLAWTAGKCKCPPPPPCCDRKPSFRNADNYLTGYASFTGPVAAATCFSDQPGGYVFGLVDIEDMTTQAQFNRNWAAAPMYHGPNDPLHQWTRNNLGNIFGLTLDDQGNIYVTATSAYQVDVFLPSKSGAVFKINGQDGKISTFAVLPNSAITPSTTPALGNISFDCAHQQFFVTNLEDGLIYRLDMNGAVKSTFDHGVQGRPKAGQLPIPDDNLPGFTQRGRRLWGVQSNGGRVYYSVWRLDFQNTSGSERNEIWSVGLTPVGDFDPATARLEIKLPLFVNNIGQTQNYSMPVSDISFGSGGRMVVAERGMVGDSSPNAHTARVLEYICTNSQWASSSTLFKIGAYDPVGGIPAPSVNTVDAVRSGNNSSGGIDYDSTNNVWVTGDALHFGPPLTFPPPVSPVPYNDVLYGLQYLRSSDPINTIQFSYLIDLNGILTSDDKTEVGDVERPCLPAVACDFPLTLTPNSLPIGTAGVNYPDTQFMASGGTAPYMYSATGLPPGLSLSMDGKLTGKPTQMGTFVFTIFVKDANGCTAEIRREIVVRCQPYTIKPDALPAGFVGAVYPKQTFTTDSPCPPVTYSVSGNLPPGLILTNGMLQGTPAQAGSYQFTVNVTDACGCPSRKIYTVVIKDCPRAPIKGLFNTGVDNNKMPLNNGVPDGHYTVTTQNGMTSAPVVIPPAGGWVTSPNARWIGKPGVAGTNRYTIQFDLSGCDPSSVSIVGRYAASLNGYILVNNSTTQLFPTPPNGAAGPTNFSINSGFQPGPNTLTFVAAPGPALGGVLVEFTEATARCCECPPIAIGPAALPAGKRNTPYGPLSLTAAGGMAPYKYSIIGGGLPNGMTLSPDGVLSGTPTVSGTFTFKVLVVDGMNCTGMREYVLVIRRRLIFFDYDARNSAANLAAEPQQSNTLTLRINVDALGDEKALSLSLGFNPAVLANPRVTLGADAAGAALNVNASQAAQGSIGMSLAMPAGRTLADGQRHVFNVLFDYAAANTGALVNFEFKDTPVARNVTGADGNPLPAETAVKPVVLAPPVASVSAANYRGEALAAEEIVAAFGVRLATTTQLATALPLPTQLAGTTVKVRDSAGTERLAALFFVSPTQVNYLVPAGTAVGTATVIVTSGNGAVSGGAVEIAAVAPGLFVADASGRGLAAANALTLKSDNTLSSQPVARFDPMTSRFVAMPIDLATTNERVFLSAFGTGLRNRNSLETVRVTIGGIEAPALYAGAQGSLAGLDQLNIEIPRSLAGSGLVDVVLMVEGKTANIAQIHIR